MKILLTTKEELVVLSVISGIRYSPSSVMNRLNTYDDMTSIVSKEQYVKLTRKFVEEGLLGVDDRKKLRLTGEAAVLFDILNESELTVIITNKVKPGIGEIFYSEKKGMGVLLTVHPDERLCLVNYPFSRDILGQWLDKEVIGDLSIEKTDFDPISYEMSEDEFVLFMMVMSYHNFLKEKSPESIPVFTLKAMKDEEYMSCLEVFTDMGVDLEGVFSIPDRLAEQVEGLTKMQLVIKEGEKFRLNDKAGEVMDTSNVRGIMGFTEVSPFQRSKNLYITNTGYILLEPVGLDPVSYKVELLPLDIEPGALIERILDFSAVRINDRMKDKLLSTFFGVQ